MRRRSPIENPNLAEAFDSLRNDYNAAKTSRFRRTRTGVGATGNTGDYHYRTESDYLRMMELSRDFARNDIVVGQGIRRLVANVVQNGFQADPQTPDKGFNEDHKAWWNAWTANRDAVDLAGELNFNSAEALILSQVIVDGDICALPLREGCLQFVEAHRLRTPMNTSRNVVHGVLLDENRKRLEYWFTRDDISPSAILSRVADIKAYPARDENGNRSVYHVYRPDRVSQTRGVTLMAPIADTIGMHDDVQFAKLVQQQLVSCFAIIEELPLSIGAGGAGPKIGEQTSDTYSDNTTRTLEGVSPGMRVTSRPGSKLTGFSPNIPNSEFFPHAMLLLTFIAINLDLPVQVLLLDAKQTNFSGWRGAMDQARLRFRDIQRWFASWFHNEVYAWKLRQRAAEEPAVRSIVARLGSAAFLNRWNFPRWPYIEPMTDAAADLLRQRNLLAAPRMVAAERGYDFDDIYRQTIDDNAAVIRAARAKAKELNAEDSGEMPIDWRELLALPTPDRVSLNVSQSTTLTETTTPEQGA